MRRKTAVILGTYLAGVVFAVAVMRGYSDGAWYWLVIGGVAYVVMLFGAARIPWMDS